MAHGCGLTDHFVSVDFKASRQLGPVAVEVLVVVAVAAHPRRGASIDARHDGGAQHHVRRVPGIPQLCLAIHLTSAFPDASLLNSIAVATQLF